jgi:hypothetical protein
MIKIVPFAARLGVSGACGLRQWPEQTGLAAKGKIG